VLDVELDGGAATGAVAVEAHVACAVLDDDGAVGAGKVLGVEVAVGGVEGEVVGDLLLGEFGGGVWRWRSFYRAFCLTVLLHTFFPHLFFFSKFILYRPAFFFPSQNSFSMPPPHLVDHGF